ncbi:MAG: hypothetical protein CMG78_12085 [Marinobacter sp.]|nr:hypothetical protein [Marinobacter sp.]|tara:strand:- start:320 stop:556 length:237 start_codon:yes stop_codon:yes gene_type:complete
MAADIIMPRILIKHIGIEINADNFQAESPVTYAEQSIELINLALQRDPYGLGAQVVIEGDLDEDNVEINDLGLDEDDT